MLDRYDINAIEQLRAVSDMLRMRIIDILQERPMTVTQVSERLDMSPAKVHYHVHELEKVGLLKLVETREKGGILEKYYQPIARNISIAPNLLFSTPPDDVLSTTNSWFDQIKEGFQRALRKMLAQKDERPHATFSFSQIYVTYDELKQLGNQIEALLKPYEKRRDLENEQEMMAALIMYPQEASQEPGASQTLNAKRDAPDLASIGMNTSSPTHAHANTWVVGVTSYTRAALETTLSEGKRLRINVAGLCRFDDDVSAELADRAIEQINVVGKLQASPAVREVVQRKKTVL